MTTKKSDMEWSEQDLRRRMAVREYVVQARAEGEMSEEFAAALIEGLGLTDPRKSN